MRFIKKTWEYQSVYRDHKRISGNFFTLLFRTHESAEGPAFGIVVRKKAGKAVIRNKIKRRLRAFCRGISKRLPENLQIVIIAGKKPAPADWQQMTADLKDCLVKCSLLKEI